MIFILSLTRATQLIHWQICNAVYVIRGDSGEIRGDERGKTVERIYLLIERRFGSHRWLRPVLPWNRFIFKSQSFLGFFSVLQNNQSKLWDPCLDQNETIQQNRSACAKGMDLQGRTEETRCVVRNQ